jgi:hypothetical protein
MIQSAGDMMKRMMGMGMQAVMMMGGMPVCCGSCACS